MIYVHGPVPGHKNTYVRVSDAKRRRRHQTPPPFPTFIPDPENPLPEEVYSDDIHLPHEGTLEFADKRKDKKQKQKRWTSLKSVSQSLRNLWACWISFACLLFCSFCHSTYCCSTLCVCVCVCVCVSWYSLSLTLLYVCVTLCMCVYRWMYIEVLVQYNGVLRVK